MEWNKHFFKQTYKNCHFKYPSFTKTKYIFLNVLYKQVETVTVIEGKWKYLIHEIPSSLRRNSVDIESYEITV